MNRLRLILCSTVLCFVVSSQLVNSASNNNNAYWYQQCVLKLLCQSPTFSDGERTSMNKVMKETILRMQMLKLNPDDVRNARTMLRLFSASISQMVGRSDTEDKSEVQERKLAYLTALEKCAPQIPKTLADELVREAARILTSMEKSYSPYIGKEDLKSGSATMDVPEKKKETLPQQRVKRAANRMLQRLQAAISNALIASPAFQNTFKPGLTQPDAIYYAKSMVESALMGYTSDVVADATNSVINALSMIPPGSLPQNYSFAFAESIATVLQTHDLAFFASGRSIGNMLASQLQRLVNSQRPQTAFNNPTFAGTMDFSSSFGGQFNPPLQQQPNLPLMQRQPGLLSSNPQNNPSQFSSVNFNPNQQFASAGNQFQYPAIQTPSNAPSTSFIPKQNQQFNPTFQPDSFAPRFDSQPWQPPSNFRSQPFNTNPVANPQNPPLTFDSSFPVASQSQGTPNLRFPNVESPFNPTNTQTLPETPASSFSNVPNFNPSSPNIPNAQGGFFNNPLIFVPPALPQDPTIFKQSPDIYPSFDIFVPPDLFPTLFDETQTGVNTGSGVPQPDTAVDPDQTGQNPSFPLIPNTNKDFGGPFQQSSEDVPGGQQPAQAGKDPNPVQPSSEVPGSQQPGSFFPQEPLPIEPGPLTDENPPGTFGEPNPVQPDTADASRNPQLGSFVPQENHPIEPSPSMIGNRPPPTLIDGPKNDEPQQPGMLIPFPQGPLPIEPGPSMIGNRPPASSTDNPKNDEIQQPGMLIPFPQGPLPIEPGPFQEGNPPVNFDDILKVSTSEYVTTPIPIPFTDYDNICSTGAFSVSPTQSSSNTPSHDSSNTNKELAKRLMDEIIDSYHNLSSIPDDSISKTGFSTLSPTNEPTTSLTLAENENSSSTTILYEDGQQQNSTAMPDVTSAGSETSENPSDADLGDPSQIFAEDISSIASDSMAFIKSPDFNLSEICEKLNKMAAVVDIPPLNVCSELALVDYLLHVLKAVINVLRVL